jgi:3-hydroxyisobutyrate dehydrogenase
MVQSVENFPKNKPVVGFVGLGVMGGAMARHVREAGYDMFVYNRTLQKAKDWVDFYGGTACETPMELAQHVDIVLMCIGNDQDVREVVTGELGLLKKLKKGAVIVDHTTTSQSLAVEMAGAAQAVGCYFLDAPVSGGQIGAQKGTLTAMVGGDQLAFLNVDSVMATYTKFRQWFGVSGTGQICKMANQVFIAGILQGLAEGVTLAIKNNINIDELVNTLKHGAAQSWQMENRAKTMAEHQFNFGFAVEHMIKDLNIVLNQAEKMGLHLPLVKTVEGFYEELRDNGHARSDTSCLIERFFDAQAKNGN